MTKNLESSIRTANTCGDLTHATRAINAVARAIRSEVRLRLHEQATYTAEEELTRASAHSQRALFSMATGSDESVTQRIMLHRSVLALIKAASRIGEIACPGIGGTKQSSPKKGITGVNR